MANPHFFTHLKSIHVQCDGIFFNLIGRLGYYQMFPYLPYVLEDLYAFLKHCIKIKITFLLACTYLG